MSRRLIEMSSTADIKHEIHNANLVPITELRIGESGDVVQINTKGLMRQRVMEMGLTTGVEVKFLRRGALGDPKSYLIRGTMIALRNEEAREIIVRRKIWRAVFWAAPAGAVIWLLGNIDLNGESLTAITSGFLDPLGRMIGLDGVVMLTYIIAIPANEIVIPTMIMAYMNESAMLELATLDQLRELLVVEHGWTLIAGINLMLFSLLHNPCSTTIVTIWKETKSVKWTTLATFIPLSLAFLITFIVYQLSRLI